MSTREQLIITARLGMLALADALKNIARAYRLAGVSRSHVYEIKQAYETFGKEGLAPKVRRRPRMPNQTPPEWERQILAMTEQYPTYSYLRLADQLTLVRDRGVGGCRPCRRGTQVAEGRYHVLLNLLQLMHRQWPVSRPVISTNFQTRALYGTISIFVSKRLVTKRHA